MSYPAIADHGLIGDLHTSALVSTDGTIDWFCCPRFDAPSVFASLLDHRRGGSFSVDAVGRSGERPVTKQMYLPDTAILVTRFLCESGVAEILDFMPIRSARVATDRHQLVRAVRGVRGAVDLRFRIDPRFGYGRAPHRASVGETSARFESAVLDLDLRSTWPLVARGEGVYAEMCVRAGDLGALVLESGASGEPTVLDRGAVQEMLDGTLTFWRRWLEHGTYRGRWREAVYRSAITLKLMTYAPSGAMVAAPTAGLPEQIGGERNWDYRYTWIRDGSFSVYALLGLGFQEEATQFAGWVRNRVEEGHRSDGGPLRVVYRVDGSSDLAEETLDHLEGYRGSAPVRIGNGAASQLQLDVYGEAMDSLYFIDQSPVGITDDGWHDVEGMLDWLCRNWDQPDDGIWETRDGPKRFIYSRLMSWVALDRGIRMANRRGRPADLPAWTAQRDAIYRNIMGSGWNASLGAFVQSDRSDVLDAALLLMPLVGFVVPNDPKWLSTLAAIEGTLVSDSLVHRYDPLASPDGLRGSEGTFSLCTFWYIDALARSGRLNDARLTFDKMLTYANHLGLFSEEIGLTGEQLGNFPQAFTHLSLINAAINLDYQLDHGAGRVDVHTGPPGSRW